MSEENKGVVKATEPVVTPDVTPEVKDATSSAEAGNAKVDFTPEQNAKIEEIIAKRTEKVLEKANKEADFKRSEAERLATLSEQEKFEEQRKSFANKEAKFNALNKLSEEGLSNKFVDMVANTDNDKMLENIAGLKSYIAEQIEKGVTGKLANSPKQVIADTKPAKPEKKEWGAGTNKNLRY
jgi:phosphopantetheinyl transferase (holo-ACP synthase)